MESEQEAIRKAKKLLKELKETVNLAKEDPTKNPEKWEQLFWEMIEKKKREKEKQE